MYFKFRNLLITFKRSYANFVIMKILPTLWPICSKFLGIVSKNNTLVYPQKGIFRSATIMVGLGKVPKSLNAVQSAVGWIKHTLEITDLEVSQKSPRESSEVVIVTLDWLKLKSSHIFLFIPTIMFALKLKRRNQKVWILPLDTFNLQWTIPSCILSAVCGGAVILQSNTSQEAQRFGLVFPSGPHLWTLNKSNFSLFYSNLPWNERNRIAVFAKSGDDIRIEIYDKYHKFIELQNYQVRTTSHELDWQKYRDLIKSSRICINTSLLQKVVFDRVGKLARNLPKNVVTFRIWEAFCSGSVVITNVNPVLGELGFLPQTHYLDLDALLSVKLSLPDEAELMEIATRGQKRFLEVIES